MTDDLAKHLAERTDPIERLRKHLEKTKHREQAFFSTKGLKVLLAMLDDIHIRWLECRSNTVALTHQRDTLKAQVERLLIGKGEDISKALREAQTSRLGVMDDEEETG